MSKRILGLEIIGTVLAVMVGSLFHFVYRWSGNNPLVALFTAINESTWEHLKLGFWPLLFWGIVEYFMFGKKRKNFIFAKAVDLMIFCLTVPILFYSYVAIFGKHFLFVDISIFVVAVVLGQFTGYKILKNKKDLGYDIIGIIVIFLMTGVFSLFSFFAPHNFLFRDPVTGLYGITKSTNQKVVSKLLNEVSYECDGGKQIKASFYAGPTVTVAPGEPPKPTGSVKLILSDGRDLTLPQTISGSGIRFATSDESVIFWSKGETAFITENNHETYSGCSLL